MSNQQKHVHMTSLYTKSCLHWFRTLKRFLFINTQSCFFFKRTPMQTRPIPGLDLRCCIQLIEVTCILDKNGSITSTDAKKTLRKMFLVQLLFQKIKNYLRKGRLYKADVKAAYSLQLNLIKPQNEYRIIPFRGSLDNFDSKKVFFQNCLEDGRTNGRTDGKTDRRTLSSGY